MKFLPLIALAAAAALTTPVVATAQASAEAASSQVSVRRGMTVVSSEGRRVGRIEDLVGGNASPTAVKVIKDSKFVSIPVSTLSSGGKEGRLQTSLAYRDIK